MTRPLAASLTTGLLILSLGIAFASTADTVRNASFELDRFTVSPGTSRDNGPITGWVSEGITAVNPVRADAGDTSPFWDNGAAPHGDQIAVLQNRARLYQDLAALDPDSWYVVRYWETARVYRQIALDPVLAVRVDDRVMVPEHPVVNVAAPGDYSVPFARITSLAFQPDAEGNARLCFETTTDGGLSVLLDQVSLERVSSADAVAPTFSPEPKGPEPERPLLMNGSFERDRIDTYPGYVAAKGLIGWECLGSVAHNPWWDTSGETPKPGGAPFADNGIPPAGSHVAILQNESEIRQAVRGFKAGHTYRVRFAENARWNAADAPMPCLRSFSARPVW
jgi:hypothetical protein